MRISAVPAALLSAILLAVPAFAAPLGLTAGDQISSISWDANKNNPGDGGEYSVGTGIFMADGRVTSVSLVGPPFNLPQANVALHFDAQFLQYNQLTTLDNALIPPNIIVANAYLGTTGGPDFVVKENGINILFGNFSTNIFVSGNINILTTSQVLVGTAQANFTGGDAALLAALGGNGAGALVEIGFSADNFNPPLAALAIDGNVFNSNFNVSLVQGTIAPFDSAPFVPEPSTALLMAGGLLGLMGVARRARRS